MLCAAGLWTPFDEDEDDDDTTTTPRTTTDEMMRWERNMHRESMDAVFMAATLSVGRAE